MDWFKPFEENPYSAIWNYLPCHLLPAYGSDRFKEENVIFIEMIPGPKGLKQNLNDFLAPHVHDLQVCVKKFNLRIWTVFLIIGIFHISTIMDY